MNFDFDIIYRDGWALWAKIALCVVVLACSCALCVVCVGDFWVGILCGLIMEGVPCAIILAEC